jgi:hypothetical protein
MCMLPPKPKTGKENGAFPALGMYSADNRAYKAYYTYNRCPFSNHVSPAEQVFPCLVAADGRVHPGVHPQKEYHATGIEAEHCEAYQIWL